jgi:hypothetical protein
MNRRVSLPAAAAVLGLAACATQPPEPVAQLAAARATLQQAQPTAARHAPAALRNAEAKLQAAEAARVRGDHAEALRLAEQAEADARLAWAQAEHERSRQALAEVNAGIETLRQEVQRRPQ